MKYPYISMYVSGLGLGLTHEELRRIPFPYLSKMIRAYNEANAPRDDSTREATQEDIQAMLA